MIQLNCVALRSYLSYNNPCKATAGICVKEVLPMTWTGIWRKPFLSHPAVLREWLSYPASLVPSAQYSVFKSQLINIIFCEKSGSLPGFPVLPWLTVYRYWHALPAFLYYLLRLLLYKKRHCPGTHGFAGQMPIWKGNSRRLKKQAFILPGGTYAD